MKNLTVGVRIAGGAVAIALFACAGLVRAQAPPEDKVAALKQSLAAGMAAVRKYEWVETTAFSLKGEEKSRKQNQCYYGADGAVQKTPIASGAPAEKSKSPRGLRGKVVENKTEDMEQYMKDAVSLVKQYVPPDPAKIQAAKDAGKVSINMLAGGQQQIQIRDYLKSGDSLMLNLDPAKGQLSGMKVASYLTKPDDAVTLDVAFATLADGAFYASKIGLDGKSKDIRVDIENSGYRPVTK